MDTECIERKFRITTDSMHHLPVAANLLEQKFDVSVPATVWGSDITYVPTDEGWLYLAGVKDFASREILGYAMGSRMTTDLAQSALKKALQFRTPSPGCIHHSDRGSIVRQNIARTLRALECSLQCLERVIAMTTLPRRVSGGTSNRSSFITAISRRATRQ